MSPTPETDCIFCKIITGDIPATVVHESEHAVGFRDLNPQAPTHVLVIPRRHVADVASLASDAPEEVAPLFDAAAAVAAAEGLTNGYRMVANTGADAQQTVFHAHIHVLGGRPMTWPPG